MRVASITKPRLSIEKRDPLAKDRLAVSELPRLAAVAETS